VVENESLPAPAPLRAREPLELAVHQREGAIERGAIAALQRLQQHGQLARHRPAPIDAMGGIVRRCLRAVQRRVLNKRPRLGIAITGLEDLRRVTRREL
jgi:hypothetical protein